MEEGLAPEKPRHVFGRLETAPPALLAGGPTRVGREDDVVHREEGFVHDRLLLENVEGGSSEVTGSECLDEGGLVHDLAAGDVNEESAGFHPGETRRVDEVVRLRGQGDERDDDVGLGEEVVEAAAVGMVGWTGSRVDHLQVECPGAALDHLRNAAVADQAERFPAEDRSLPAERLHSRGPLAGADEAVRLGDPAGQVEDEAEGVIGGRLGEGVGRVRRGDAAALQFGEIEVVDAHGCIGDDAQVRSGVEQLGIDAQFTLGDEAGAPADAVEHLGARGRGDPVVEEADPGTVVQGSKMVGGNTESDDDFGGRLTHETGVREMTFTCPPCPDTINRNFFPAISDFPLRTAMKQLPFLLVVAAAFILGPTDLLAQAGRTITLTNKSSVDLRILKGKSSGNGISQGTLRAGATKEVNSAEGRVWSFLAEGKVVATYTSTDQSVQSFTIGKGMVRGSAPVPDPPAPGLTPGKPEKGKSGRDKPAKKEGDGNPKKGAGSEKGGGPVTGNTGSNVSAAEATQFLQAHNQARQEVGVRPLAWSKDLASWAQKQADRIAKSGQFAHTQGAPYGENLGMGSGGYGPVNAAQGWYDEKKFHRKGQPAVISGSRVTGHYTQMVWSGTARVGAGKAVIKTGSYKGWTVIVGAYDPPGNMNGQPPY